MKAKLLQHIVIPAGTVFDTAPVKMILVPPHVEHTIGLTKNTHGTIIFSLDKLEAEELSGWFQIIEE
jgi:hypothetical protein